MERPFARASRERAATVAALCVSQSKPNGGNTAQAGFRRSRERGPKGNALDHSFPVRKALTPARIDNVDTMTNIRLMTKARSTSPDRLGAATSAVAERPSAAGAKGSINLRIETHTRQLIDDAAAVLGKTRTEFMIESARKLAIDVLLDQRLFVLDPERYDAAARQSG